MMVLADWLDSLLTSYCTIHTARGKLNIELTDKHMAVIKNCNSSKNIIVSELNIELIISHMAVI
jgi:hypothetical protein